MFNSSPYNSQQYNGGNQGQVVRKFEDFGEIGIYTEAFAGISMYTEGLDVGINQET